MSVASAADPAKTVNPLRDDRQVLKLGLFGTNVSGGICMTEAPTTFEVSWAHTMLVAQLAEKVGFELLVPVARWRGYGGRTDPNGTSFETLTWAAGVAAQTGRICVVATCHAPAVHPVLAAKATATVDHISSGRFALNVVMGWFTPELIMLGLDPLAHDARYRFGAEWIEIARRLWTNEEPFNFDGQFFSLESVVSRPKPLRRNGPPVINAGSSPAGLAFSAAHADVNFTSIFTLETAAYQVRRTREMAAAVGRDVLVMSFGMVCCAPTEAAAQARYDSILARGDWEAGNNFMQLSRSQADIRSSTRVKC